MQYEPDIEALKMKHLPAIIPILLSLLIINPAPCVAESPSSVEIVEAFTGAYGGPNMDEIAELTTPRFRDGKLKSVWVVDTWKELTKIGYERLRYSVLESKVKGDRAVVVIDAKITTKAGETIQKEIFYLVKNDEKWLIDELLVTDEEFEFDKTEL